MKDIKVWDPLVRVFHWTLVIGFTANALFIVEDSQSHIVVGYIILGLVAVRVLWGFVGPFYARFRSFPPDPAAAMDQVGEIAKGGKTVHMGHTPLGALMIYNLLLSILAISLTGWLLTTDAYWGVGWMKELHGSVVVWAEASVIVHIAAVLFESWRTGVNLPKAMVTGYKRMTQQTADIPVSETE